MLTELHGVSLGTHLFLRSAQCDAVKKGAIMDQLTA